LGTSKFSYVPVRHDPRYAGKSNYTFIKLVRHTFNMVTGFSILPLRLASLLGFVFTIFGFLVLVYVIGRDLIQGIRCRGSRFWLPLSHFSLGCNYLRWGSLGNTWPACIFA